MNRHFYKLKIPVYKQPLRTIQDRNRFQSWILYCWFWGIKNSQFDKPASSVYRRLEAPCNIAVPANNIGSTDSVIWRPREGPFRPARCWLQGSARRLPKRRAEMKLSALLTEGALYHLSSNFWVRKTLHVGLAPTLQTSFITACKNGLIIRLWIEIKPLPPLCGPPSPHGDGKDTLSVKPTCGPSGFDERPTTNELRLFPPFSQLKKDHSFEWPFWFRTVRIRIRIRSLHESFLPDQLHRF